MRCPRGCRLRPTGLSRRHSPTSSATPARLVHLCSCRPADELVIRVVTRRPVNPSAPARRRWRHGRSGCASGSRSTAEHSSPDPHLTAVGEWRPSCRTSVENDDRTVVVDDQPLVRAGLHRSSSMSRTSPWSVRPATVDRPCRAVRERTRCDLDGHPNADHGRHRGDTDDHWRPAIWSAYEFSSSPHLILMSTFTRHFRPVPAAFC